MSAIMKDDEYGLLPPEYDGSGNEFNESKIIPEVAVRTRKEVAQKKRHKKLMLKMLFGTVAAVTVFSTTPAWEKLSGNAGEKNAQTENIVVSIINDVADIVEKANEDSEPSKPSVKPHEEESTEETKSEAVNDISEDDETATETSLEEVVLYCEECFGTGLCLTCHNNGYIRCDVISDSCSLCKGSGVRICPSCGGSGACAPCGGSGEGDGTAVRYDLCPRCEGNGIICGGSAAADDPEGCHGSVAVNCKACDNTGKNSNGKPCSWCKGTLRHLCPSFEVHKVCSDCEGLGVVPATD